LAGGDELNDAVLMVLGYLYVLAVIVFSREAWRWFKCSKETSRKLLHILVGNLVFLIPLFENWLSPVLIAAPFIIITLLASPHTPLKLRAFDRIGLREISSRGHGLGLVYYSLAYTLLAGLFFHKPQVAASGIIPMTYGDGFAALIGGRPGLKRYRLLSGRSLEGSLVFFASSFLGLALHLGFLSTLQTYPLHQGFTLTLLVAFIGTMAEAFTPRGFDNLTVPFVCVLAAKALGEW